MTELTFYYIDEAGTPWASPSNCSTSAAWTNVTLSPPTWAGSLQRLTELLNQVEGHDKLLSALHRYLFFQRVGSDVALLGGGALSADLGTGNTITITNDSANAVNVADGTWHINQTP